MVNNNLHKFCSLFFTTQENGTIHIQKVAAPENGTKEVGQQWFISLFGKFSHNSTLLSVTVNSRDDL